MTAISAIVIDLQEKGALVAPHIVKNIGDKVASDGNESDVVALAFWFARLDTLVHLLVLGNALTEMESDVDSGVAPIGRALFGDVLRDKESSARDVLAGGEAKKAGQVLATMEAMHITDFADQGQGVADTGWRITFRPISRVRS